MRSARIDRPSGRIDLQRRRAVDDVAVGEDEAVRREDDAGAAASSDVDLHDRRADGLDGAHHRLRIRVEERRIGLVVEFSARDHRSSVTRPMAVRITHPGRGAIRDGLVPYDGVFAPEPLRRKM